MKPLIIFLASGFVATGLKVITFDQDMEGKPPSGWTVAMTSRGEAPRWVVRTDLSAPTPPHVLAQVSTDAADSRCPLAILDGLTLRDGDVSVRMKPVSGREDRAGGLVWRYSDPNNYYLARANALAKNVAIFRVENGRRIQIVSYVPHDIPSNDWSILKVSIRGNRFQVYINHHRLISAVDDTFRGSGRVGLWTVADSVTYFDDFRVNPK
jgi:hypothetical protein